MSENWAGRTLAEKAAMLAATETTYVFCEHGGHGWGRRPEEPIPLADERLAAIESFWSQRLNRDNSVVNTACDDVPELVAEIRRLRSANRLLHLSRGSADDMGRD